MSSRIVLQITDFLQYIFINSDQILHYLNQYFEKHMNSMQYCEGTDNGFLFIFRDIEAFKIRASPIKLEMLDEIPKPLMDKMDFFQSFFIPKHKFPLEGIEVEIKVVAGVPAEVKKISEKFILSISPKIIITHLDAQTLVMKIQSYEIVQLYVNSLVRRFYLPVA
ncbi:MAG: hypothetical protein DRO88_04235 [Promethearchaeia archaeon]|nr:MAG: hypothetical protein DRO88_04235 [Candidatus Lokiarchaeia archaeon]